ncbi:hypothetical protein A3F29_01490 [Candidatus Roizmanbacteria bacterium RIFCSPHIGHO2_12_FULL_33_9]|uniref:Transcriptional regulator MraZ n=1 Tax=Candidatus Roizmanbacteria bacterium RIFCSPHIGHO2_12_FULL_33_9 TaxID=1802045 RepID=A0A1F7HJW2_9BACT|nr:MAG: hypothetical protein A3F29_01490 [Candidatus Roizmanbacteria bacterium RIFCSPHIGHO2_12_FULL_33_9]
MVFFGEYLVSFTAPGRVVLPKKIRELLKGNIFILSKGFNNCLAGFDKDAWEQKAKELVDVSLLENENLEKRRFLFSSTVYLEIDDQGRFVIPKNMLDYSSLKNKAQIIGVGDHFEIWSLDKWEKFQSQTKV